ncbi:hypothetical protein [Pilimelia anulata]|uniref:hypothetical protein n=1 Tax=Pilimelia anulata TaxID=53371 RepID=UPI001668B37A|nr:hypothetical protein [Pilimelia anulata]
MREQQRPVAWPQPVHAVLSLFSTLGGLFIWSVLLGRTSAGWSDLIDAFVLSPLLNAAVGFMATVAAIILILTPKKLRARAFAPLVSMLRVLLAVVGSIVLLAVGVPAAVLAGVWFCKWLWGVSWLAVLVVIVLWVPVAAFVVYLHVVSLVVLTGTYVRDQLRSWFGAADVHPLLPVHAKALLAVMQVVVGAVAILGGKGGGNVFLVWLLVLAVAGHSGMFALMMVELRQRLSGRLPIDGRTPPPQPLRPRENPFTWIWGTSEDHRYR